MKRTITGRKPLEPVVQNIPIRTELGAEIRAAFIAQSAAAADEQRRILDAARAAGADVYEDMIVFVDEAEEFTPEQLKTLRDYHVLRSMDEVDAAARPAPVVQNRDDTFYRTAGYNAQRLGLTSFQCPYKAPDRRARLWVEGYGSAKREAAPPMEVTDPALHPASAVRPPERDFALNVQLANTPFRSRTEIKTLLRNRPRFSNKFFDRKREINYKRGPK